MLSPGGEQHFFFIAEPSMFFISNFYGQVVTVGRKNVHLVFRYVLCNPNE